MSILSLTSFPFPVPNIALKESDSDMATPLAGLLVIQDIQLGFLVALMPFINKSDVSWLFWVLQLLQVVFGFPLLLFLTRGLTSKLLEKFYRLVHCVYLFYWGVGVHAPMYRYFIPYRSSTPLDVTVHVPYSW